MSVKKGAARPLLMFAVLAVAYFLVYFHRTTGGAVSDTLQDFFGVGTVSVALLASAYLYAYTLMMIPSGILTDNLGPRKTATIFIILIAVGSIFSSYAASTGDFTYMIVGKFIIGIGAAMVYIPALKILAVWFCRDRFASMNGILLFVGNVGAIAAATPMVLLMDAVGIMNTYLILSALTVIIAVLCWLVVRDRPEGAASNATAQERIPTVQALRMIFTSGRKFWPLAIWLFIMYGTLMLWQASQAGSFYSSVHGFSATDAGLMVTMVGVGMAIACPLAGVISDKVLRSRRKVLIIGSIMYTAVWAMILLTIGNDAGDSMTVQAAINLMLGFSGGFSVVAFAQIKELFPVSVAGMSTASINLFSFSGGAILVTLAGFIITEKTVAEYTTLWTAVVIMMAIATVISFLTVEKRSE